MRKSLYISKRLDQDILAVIESFPEGDFSLNIKKLIRDGITFRTLGNHTDTGAARRIHAPISSKPEVKQPFAGVTLKRSTLSDEELSSKMNQL